MKSYLWAVLAWGLFLSGTALYAQVQTNCNPTANLPATKGQVFLNYGAVTNSRSPSRSSSFTLGQPLVGRVYSDKKSSEYGFWSIFLLAPQAPTTSASQGDFPDRVQIKWTTNPLSSVAQDGFIIKRDGAFLDKVEAGITQYIDFNVLAGERYKYTVQGVNRFGEGMPGASVGFVNPNGVVSGRILTRNGTPVVGAVVKLSPSVGTSMSFDGINDFLCVSHNDSLPSNMWTVSTWVKIGATHDNDGIIDLGSDLKKNIWLHTTSASAGKGVLAGIGTGSARVEISHEFGADPDGWHHVAAVYGGGSLLLYVDGNFVGSTQGNLQTEDCLLSIGSSRDSSNYFDGKIDDVRIYNRLLTQTEIMETSDVSASQSTPGLVAYWKFDEGIGVKAFDLGKNKMDAFIQGASFSADAPSISNGAMTDTGGFYNIEGVNYSSVQSFQAKPYKYFYNSYALEFNAAYGASARLTNFDLPDTATVELSVYPFDRNNRQTLLSKRNAGGEAFELFIENATFKLTLNGETKTLGAVGNGYQHLAITLHKANNSVVFYLNGNVQNTLSFTAVGGTWNGEAWQLGAKNLITPSSFFTGLIDEVAFFDTTLIQSDIQLHASLAPAGGIPSGDGHLFAHFPLNEGQGTAISDFGPRMTGNGTVQRASFSINTYRSGKKPHEFTPSSRQININPSNTAISQIDFTDVSTVGISGVIRFQNTFCYQKEVEILVNGASHTPPIFTDIDGRFVGDFAPGETVKLTPKTEDNSFSPGFFTARNLQSPIAGVLFQNTTKRTLEGRIVGGACRLPVINQQTGDRVIVELRADNGCFIRRDTVEESNGAYRFSNVPPLNYTVGIADGSTTSIFDFFEPLGGSSVDLRKVKRDTIDFIYFSSPIIELKGLDDYKCGNTPLGSPLLASGEKANVEIKVYEPYLDAKCYLDTAEVSVTNNISDLSEVNYQLTGSRLKLSFITGEPNFVAPYEKTYSVAVRTKDGRTADFTKSVKVTGSKSLTALILPTNPPIYPFYILRDPPGDGSFATLEKNKQVCRTYGLTGNFVDEQGVAFQIGNTYGVPAVSKLGTNKLTLGYNYTFTEEKERSTQLCVTLNESISTPESDEFVGSEGDTYIGAALNIGLGQNLNLKINSATCTFKIDTTWNPSLAGFATDFVFTEKHIKNVVIPQAEAVGETKTANRWRAIIARNLDLKNKAKEPADLSIMVNDGSVIKTGDGLNFNDRDQDGELDIDDSSPCGSEDDWDIDGKENMGRRVWGGLAQPIHFRDWVVKNYKPSKVDSILQKYASNFDNCPTVFNKDQNDTDGDYFGDACDPDIDGDSKNNDVDNCPYKANADQKDSNQDGQGDVCQNDFDNDGILDVNDNCPTNPNPDQKDSNGDGIGDVCESDADKDGIPDSSDPCPLNCKHDDCDQDTELASKLTLGKLRKNVTFSAGVVYTAGWSQDTITSISETENDDHTLGLEAEFGFGDDGAPVGVFGSITGSLNLNWGHGEYESNDKTNTTTVTYTLTDDDYKDFYTVDILTDSRYKTPVFRLKGGDSSCPYEDGKWKDTDQRVTRNRDQVNFGIDRNTATNVGENDKAIFKLAVGNASITNETRTYIVRMIDESNPDGAIVKLGGKTGPQTLTLKAGEQINLVMTVEKGPVAFTYDSLRVVMYAECEYDPEEARDGEIDSLFYEEMAFDVQFVAGCSKVDLAFPSAGWVVTDPNPLTSKQQLQLNNYDENKPELLEIRTQYRKVGGSGIWINFDTITKAKLGAVDTYSDWFVGELEDGKYELRAITMCNAGLAPGSSNFIEGRLERKPPKLFGSPEPADGKLSPGDEISIAFNEEIRCNEIFQADGIGTKINFNNLALFDLTTSRLIDATISCDGDKIIIVPNIDNAFIENHTLKVIVNNIKDLVGNKSAQIAWEFYVDRSALTWEGNEIDEVMVEGKGLTTTRRIRNQSGISTDFKLLNIPTWVRVFPTAGTIQPGSSQLITFEFDPNLPNGLYTQTIEMDLPGGIEGEGEELLEVKLRVICPAPEWSVKPSAYKYSMNMTLQLDIEGEFSTDKEDIVAAFINNECRGLAKVQYVTSLNKWLAFLTLYSDTLLNDSVRLQIWDASACLLYGTVLEKFNFESESLVGSPLTPQIVHTNNLILRKIPLNEGWNWISFNLQFPNPNLNVALNSLLYPQNDFIKGQTAFSQYFNGDNQWVGSLDTLLNPSMYQYRADRADTISMIGRPINLATNSIPLNAGWNWVGYLPQRPLPLNLALSSLVPLNGDVIKSQTSFAQYVAGYGWIGNLDFMEAPKGYLIKLSNANTLTYPTPSTLDGPTEKSKFKEVNLAGVQSTSHWVVDHSKFEHNMTLIGMIAADRQNITAENFELGTFVGKDLRGSTQAIYVKGLNAYLFFLTIYANKPGELLSFKLYNGQEVKDLGETMFFSADAQIGAVQNPQPFVLRTSTGLRDLQLIPYFEVSPNPLQDQATISFAAEQAQEARITILDAIGASHGLWKIYTQPGINEFRWDARAKGGSLLPSGVYFVKLEMEGKVALKKMLIQR